MNRIVFDKVATVSMEESDCNHEKQSSVEACPVDTTVNQCQSINQSILFIALQRKNSNQITIQFIKFCSENNTSW